MARTSVRSSRRTLLRWVVVGTGGVAGTLLAACGGGAAPTAPAASPAATKPASPAPPTSVAASPSPAATPAASPAASPSPAATTAPAATGTPAAQPTAPAGATAGATGTAVPSANLRLLGWSSSPEEDRLLNEVIAEFSRRYPTITVRFEPVAEYATKLQTDLAAGSAADVFYVDSLLAPDLMKRNLLLELDSFLQRDRVDTADFYPNLLRAFQRGGKTYGLPKDWSSLAMEYNSAVAIEAGVERAPTTWEELRTAAQKMTRGRERFGAVTPPDLARWAAFAYAAGARLLNEDGTALAINSPEALAALDYYYGLYRDGFATTPTDVGTEWPGDTLVKGKAALIFEGNWVFPFVKKNAPDLRLEIAELPAGPKGRASLAFTVSYSAFRNTPNREAAWLLISYLTGPEGMKRWTSLGLAMPARRSLEADWVAQFREREPFIRAAAYVQPWQLGPGGQEIFDKVANPTLKDVFAGRVTPRDALAQIERRGNEVLAKQ